MPTVTIDDHPGATLDQLSGAIHHIRETWGDYGYRLAYHGSDLFAVYHRDIAWDNPPTFLCDRYGNIYNQQTGE